MKKTCASVLAIMLIALFGCNKDCPIEPEPDCWNPSVADELLEPDTNTCLTDHTWNFTQIYLGGSTWHGAVEHPLINTYPHQLQFDTQGLYYVVYHGDTVQSGRLITHDFPYPYETPPPPGQTVEFMPDCVEADTFLIGMYGMQCDTHADSSGLLRLRGQYYLYGGYDSYRLVIYGFTE